MNLSTILRENALFTGLYKHISQLSPLLRYLILAAISILIAALFVFKILLPLHASRANAQQRLPQLERDYVLMQAQAIEIETLRRSGAVAATPNLSAATAAAGPTPLSIAAITAQFGATAVITKTSDSVFQLTLTGTTVAQFIDNMTALQTSTGAVLGAFNLTRNIGGGVGNSSEGRINATATVSAPLPGATP